jgi:quercetin dioxygenase-like cupin family protein
MALIRKEERCIPFKKEMIIERHFHDYDEMWYVVSGTGHAIEYLKNGEKKEYDLGPGDMLLTSVGDEHEGRCTSDEPWVLKVFSSTLPEGARMGHLHTPKDMEEKGPPAFALKFTK